MYAQTSGGRSFCSYSICQSSHILQSSSHSLSRKDCSSGVSSVYLNASSCCQSGRPRNICASHQVSPASSASRSVDDISGSTFLKERKIGRVTIARRSGRRFSRTPAATYTAPSTAKTVVPMAPLSPRPSNSAPTATVQTSNGAPTKARPQAASNTNRINIEVNIANTPEEGKLDYARPLRGTDAAGGRSSAPISAASRGMSVLIISFRYSLNCGPVGIRSGVSPRICRLPMKVA